MLVVLRAYWARWAWMRRVAELAESRDAGQRPAASLSEHTRFASAAFRDRLIMHG